MTLIDTGVDLATGYRLGETVRGEHRVPAPLTTRQQVNGYRFLLRRLEHALIRRDVRMLHDPMRAHLRSLSIGIALTLLAVGGCAVYGLIKPAGSVGESKIVVGKQSGGLFVLVGDTLHPVLNVASARLIVGSANSPASVSDSKLQSYSRGPLLGIAGAPTSLPGPADASNSYWNVCDTARVPSGAGSMAGGVTLSVLGNRPESVGSNRRMAGNEAAYVQADDKRYLIYDGRRAQVDTDDAAVMRALKLEDKQPRPISTGLLNAFPQAPELTTPMIANRGKQAGGPSALAARVGNLLQVSDVATGQRTLYVVLADGIQKVTPAAAAVIAAADPAGADPITVAPGLLTQMRSVQTLPVGEFPGEVPTVISQSDSPVLCYAWSREGESDAKVTALVGDRLPIPADRSVVQLATADGADSGVDEFYLPPGTGAFVRSTGSNPGSTRAESLLYISDVGVRYGIPDAQTGQALGLGDKPQRAPWAALGLLVAGPMLSRTNALVAHDAMPADSQAAVIDGPGN